MLGLTPNSGNVSDYFDCSSDPFPPTGFPRPALMRGFVRGLNWSCGMFGLCPLEVFSSLGEKAEVGGGIGGVDEGKTAVRIHCLREK